MYLIRYNRLDKILYTLVVIDSTSNIKVKRFINKEFANVLMKNGVKCFETINQEVKVNNEKAKTID